MVHIRLPEVFTYEFYALIPKQREIVNALLEERKLLSYSLDMERKQVWAIFELADEKELSRVLNTFPILHDVQLEVHLLAFHNQAPIHLPDLILN